MFGQAAVEQDLKFFQDGVATYQISYKPPGAVAITFENAYRWPNLRQLTVGDGAGSPVQLTTITIWRMGETTRPVVGGKITASSIDYNIVEISQIYDEDEADHYCVYECSCTRTP